MCCRFITVRIVVCLRLRCAVRMDRLWFSGYDSWIKTYPEKVGDDFGKEMMMSNLSLSMTERCLFVLLSGCCRRDVAGSASWIRFVVSDYVSGATTERKEIGRKINSFSNKGINFRDRKFRDDCEKKCATRR